MQIYALPASQLVWSIEQRRQHDIGASNEPAYTGGWWQAMFHSCGLHKPLVFLSELRWAWSVSAVAWAALLWPSCYIVSEAGHIGACTGMGFICPLPGRLIGCMLKYMAPFAPTQQHQQ
jgi:hypothetical protein